VPSAVPIRRVASCHAVWYASAPGGCVIVGAMREYVAYCSWVSPADTATMRSGCSAAIASVLTSPVSTCGCPPCRRSLAHGQVAAGRLPVNSRMATGTTPSARIVS
jgi:hypothetical protein